MALHTDTVHPQVQEEEEREGDEDVPELHQPQTGSRVQGRRSLRPPLHHSSCR